MNREAAALGIPAASIYAGEWAAIDEELVGEGRLRSIGTRMTCTGYPLRKNHRPQRTPRVACARRSG